MTLEKNKEKVEAKGQKLSAKDTSRLIRNYKKREDAMKQGTVMFDEFRNVFLSCVQNRFIIGNPVVQNYIENKLRNFVSMGKLYQHLYDERSILSMKDDINLYKDKLFQSRIGDISVVNSEDLRNQSNLFDSHLAAGERLTNADLIKGAEVKPQVLAFQESHTLDFKRKPINAIPTKEMADFDRISSINNSQVAKEDETKVLGEDDLFNLDGFGAIKQSTPLTDSANKAQQKISPVINFKNKMGSFRTQEFKAQDLPQMHNGLNDSFNKSKFDFDFGSVQPNLPINNIDHDEHRTVSAPIAHDVQQPVLSNLNLPPHNPLVVHKPELHQGMMQDSYNEYPRNQDQLIEQHIVQHQYHQNYNNNPQIHQNLPQEHLGAQQTYYNSNSNPFAESANHNPVTPQYQQSIDNLQRQAFVQQFNQLSTQQPHAQNATMQFSQVRHTQVQNPQIGQTHPQQQVQYIQQSQMQTYSQPQQQHINLTQSQQYFQPADPHTTPQHFQQNYSPHHQAQQINVQQPMYGQFDQRETDNAEPIHNIQPVNSQEFHPNADLANKEQVPKVVKQKPPLNENQNYPIQIDKNVSSDEEYTYY